jgi:hypothetical protein
MEGVGALRGVADVDEALRFYRRRLKTRLDRSEW